MTQQYNQFCPISKAAEILGERWTILILHQVQQGVRRFNAIQRGLGDISPALLTARLKSLEAQGMILRRRIPGQKGFEYHPTPACEAMTPLLFAMGEWGLLWAQHMFLDSDYDAEFLLTHLERSVDAAKLGGAETVIKFRFTDLAEQRDWWLVVRSDGSQVCLKDPGRDVNVYFTCSVRTMAEVWMGDRSFRDAISSGDLAVQGDPGLTRNVTAWLRPSLFAASPRGAAPV